MNVSLISLTLTRLYSGSPVLSYSSAYNLQMSSFKNLKVSQTFSSFLFQSGIPKLFIEHSSFSKIMDSCIVIASVSIEGVSNSQGTAVSLTGNFSCTDTVFLNNSSPAFGGAVYVLSRDILIANFANTTFEENIAAMGGAIYFCAPEGDLVSEGCTFTSNYANTGSDIFIAKASTTMFTGVTIYYSQGISSLHFATENPVANFAQCKFFRNEAGILFMKDSLPKFTECCFTNYEDVPPYDKMINNFFITTYAEGSKYTLEKCCVNFHMVSGEWSNEDVETELTALGKTNENADCEFCRVIPLPTPTVAASWNLPAAKLTIIAVCAFALVSIIGVLLVCFCGVKIHGEEWDMSNGNSD